MKQTRNLERQIRQKYLIIHYNYMSILQFQYNYKNKVIDIIYDKIINYHCFDYNQFK